MNPSRNGGVFLFIKVFMIMEYSISEKRLRKILFNFFDSVIEPDKIESYNVAPGKDYYVRGTEIIFTYYKPEFFSEGSYPYNKSPILSLGPRTYTSFNRQFNSLWENFFLEWAQNKFQIPIKSIEG